MTPPNTSRLTGWPLQRASRLRLHSESGGTLIETALAISLLLAFIFGIIEVSLALYSYHFISDAAREGTRYAIVRGSTWETSPWDLHGAGGPCATYSSSGCTASKQNIEDYVTNLAFPGINKNNMQVNPVWLSTIGGTAGSAFNSPGNVIQVQVQYTFPFSLPFVPMTKFTMSSTSEMLISQ